MPARFWIKLYHEILDDPKMGKLSDRLFRRTIELFLVAGDYDDEGKLPGIEIVAWRLRLSAKELEEDLVELEKVDIVCQEDGVWKVTKFADRQAAASSTQRWREWDKRRRKQDYYEGQTETQRDANDTFADKIRIDKKRKEKKTTRPDPDHHPELKKIAGAGGDFIFPDFPKHEEDEKPGYY